MSLIEKYMPSFHHRDRYETTVKCQPSEVWPLISDLNFRDSVIIRMLFALRGLPARATSGKGLHEVRFIPLDKIDAKELIMGLVGQFWRPNGDLQMLDSEEFISFAQKGFTKATWNFELTPLGNGWTRATTETRIYCTDEVSLRKFRHYWFFIRPFSGMVRKEILAGIKKKAEHTSGSIRKEQ